MIKRQCLPPTLLVLCLFLRAKATADFNDGLAAYSAGDYETAVHKFKALAEQGDTVAQYNLGSMYENGQGILQNNKEAVKW